MLTVRQRYACIRTTGDRRRDARHDFERNAVRPQELYFLATAAEDERIAALQAHDPPAGLSLFEHDFVDAALPDRMPARLLADADAIGVAARKPEHLGRHEAVVQITSACCNARSALRVSRPASPGPAPTSITEPRCGAFASARVRSSSRSAASKPRERTSPATGPRKARS
jgi:hypothetical protein